MLSRAFIVVAVFACEHEEGWSRSKNRVPKRSKREAYGENERFIWICFIVWLKSDGTLLRPCMIGMETKRVIVKSHIHHNAIEMVEVYVARGTWTGQSN